MREYSSLPSWRCRTDLLRGNVRELNVIFGCLIYRALGGLSFLPLDTSQNSMMPSGGSYPCLLCADIIPISLLALPGCVRQTTRSFELVDRDMVLLEHVRVSCFLSIFGAMEELALHFSSQRGFLHIECRCNL